MFYPLLRHKAHPSLCSPDFKLKCEKKVAFSVTPNIFNLQRPEEGNGQPRDGGVAWRDVAGSQLRGTDTFAGETGEGITQKMHKERSPKLKSGDGSKTRQSNPETQLTPWKPGHNVTGPEQNANQETTTATLQS